MDYQYITDKRSSAKTLVISYVGMETQELAIKPKLRVLMESSSQALEEVMVVAYGTAKKSAFTGSASTMKAEKIAERQVANVTNALAGQVAGVQGVSANGQPGKAATIRIRGIGSMSSSSSPLYVVDGVPYDGDIAAINPNDIESMSVLKDASASAIYGARGANGVVLITTKKGTAREAVVTVDAKWGSNSRAVPQYNVMKDPAMYYETAYKALYNSKAYAGGSAADARAYALNNIFSSDNGGVGYQVYTTPNGEDFIGTDGRINPNATLGYSDGSYYYTPDDWYDNTFNKGNLRQEYNATVSGASEKINYYFSLGYLDDAGIISGSGFTRYTGRSKVDYQAKSWLKIGANMAYTYYDSKAPDAQDKWGSSGNLFYITDLIAPVYPIYVRNNDGSIKVDNRGYTVYDFGNSTGQVRPFMPMANPGVTLELDKFHAYTDVLNTKFYAIVDLYKGLQFTANVGVNSSNQRSSILNNPFYGGAVGSEGYVNVKNERNIGLNQQYLLTYKQSFGSHNIDALVGYESYNLKIQKMEGSNKKLYNPFIGELSNAIQTPPTVSSSTDTYSTLGILARVQYDYDGKYFASASYRRDASSRFHPDHRWGNFGSVGAAWLMNKEEFFKNLDATWIDLLKIKASYGVQGNDNLLLTDGITPNYYAYLDQYTVSNSAGDFATSFTYKGNKDITWETSYSFNAGLEFTLFKERLSGSFEYFSRKTVDLLYNQPVPISLGYSTIPMNVGSMRNAGVELDLNADIIRTKDLTWSFNLNMTHYKNKILDLAETAKNNGGIKSSVTIRNVGGSLYNAYLVKDAGVDPETGKALYYVDPDNGDMTTTDDFSAAKQSDLGSTLPKIYGGFGTSVQYRGFDVSVGLSYQLGGKVYDYSYQQLMHSGEANTAGTNWHKDILNAWSETNKGSNIPRISSADKRNQDLSSRFLQSSNYLSLNSVMVGYTFPKKWTTKFMVNNLRIFFSGDNVALIASRKGLDARQNLGVAYFGNDDAVGAKYSALRSLSGGISVTF
ncbi:TonB-dependent receptor [Parabacteroides sp. TM07-1AC]|uniref:SusC/RagA family TonB-linked outer membrane protein n=1 Tax=uncultured Parabacteroides sp. TaxID=512312 RepID=UPI0029390D27|nr:TonB-dependent receptor [Parabacteroides sp. TM07-1AC]